MQNNTPSISDELLEKKRITEQLEKLRDERTIILDKIHKIEKAINKQYASIQKIDENKKQEMERMVRDEFDKIKKIDDKWDELINELKEQDRKISRKINNPAIYFLNGIDNIKF